MNMTSQDLAIIDILTFNKSYFYGFINEIKATLAMFINPNIIVIMCTDKF